jgi:tetratricopeptide (TPR) repeat protein
MTTSLDEMLIEAKEHFLSGNYSVAEPLLQQLVLKSAKNPEIFQMLATLFYDKGQFNKAIRTFQRALEIDPTYTDASVGLSIILNDLGRYDEGKKVFEDAQRLLDRRSGKLDPYIEEKIAAKHEELADLYFQYKAFSDSLLELQKAQRLSTRKAEISLRIAECHVQLGNPEKAIRELRETLRSHPHLVAARLKLGVVFYNMNQLAEAVEQWENILLKHPKHPEALKYLKMAQAAGITSLTF